MARQITKQLAVRIVEKLKAKKSPSQRKGAPHDLYDVEEDGVVVTQISIRRSSNKEIGHDHIPGELNIGMSNTKKLGQCPLSRNQFIDILKEKGLIVDSTQEALDTADNVSETDDAAD